MCESKYERKKKRKQHIEELSLMKVHVWIWRQKKGLSNLAVTYFLQYKCASLILMGSSSNMSMHIFTLEYWIGLELVVHSSMEKKCAQLCCNVYFHSSGWFLFWYCITFTTSTFFITSGVFQNSILNFYHKVTANNPKQNLPGIHNRSLSSCKKQKSFQKPEKEQEQLHLTAVFKASLKNQTGRLFVMSVRKTYIHYLPKSCVAPHPGNSKSEKFSIPVFRRLKKIHNPACMGSMKYPLYKNMLYISNDVRV